MTPPRYSTAMLLAGETAGKPDLRPDRENANNAIRGQTVQKPAGNRRCPDTAKN
jgi:hypothetical protein